MSKAPAIFALLILGFVMYGASRPNKEEEAVKKGTYHPKFVVYHATPIENLESVKQTGIHRSVPKLPRTRWSPTKPAVYFANNVGNVIDYAEQTHEYYRMTEPRWAIFKIEYDEFPTEPHADLEWGLPGVYWADIDIPPGHVKLFGIFDVESHKWVNPDSENIKEPARGTCYEDAWRFVIKEEEGTLIHGTAVSLGSRIPHAWVELPTGYIWEPYSGGYLTKERFRELVDPIEEYRYSATEAAIMAARVGKHGPWSEEERTAYLKGKPAPESTE